MNIANGIRSGTAALVAGKIALSVARVAWTATEVVCGLDAVALASGGIGTAVCAGIAAAVGVAEEIVAGFEMCDATVDEAHLDAAYFRAEDNFDLSNHIHGDLQTHDNKLTTHSSALTSHAAELTAHVNDLSSHNTNLDSHDSNLTTRDADIKALLQGAQATLDDKVEFRKVSMQVVQVVQRQWKKGAEYNFWNVTPVPFTATENVSGPIFPFFPAGSTWPASHSTSISGEILDIQINWIRPLFAAPFCW